MADDSTALIGIDWGTSRLRAYCIDRDGQLLERRDGNLGLSIARDGDFHAALQSVTSGWRENIPVLMCGMIGSRQGWKETAYCPCPFGIDELSRTIVPVTDAGGGVYIVGGGRTIDEHKHHDIMRGEETQFLGLADLTGRHVAVAPGTHSKWALLDDARIIRFRTYMTGELFAVLKKHSILGWLMPDGQSDAIDSALFEDGVKDAIADPDMLHCLFNVRTSGLFQPERTGTLSSYLSGLLIGYEVAGAAKLYRADSITVIAAPPLAHLYERALSLFGFNDVRQEEIDAVTARGLWRIWQARKDAS